MNRGKICSLATNTNSQRLVQKTIQSDDYCLLTCSTAFMSSKSSVGFHRPRSLVTCSGCLLFFTLLVIGAGFNTIVRGGVSVDPDLVI